MIPADPVTSIGNLLRGSLLALGLMAAPHSAFGQSETVFMHELVSRDGVFFKAHTRVPFTGVVRGRGQIVDGLRDGPWIFFDDNGQRLSEGSFREGREDGAWVFFHPNGQLASKGAFENGERDGVWRFFKPNGTDDAQRSGLYRAGVRID